MKKAIAAMLALGMTLTMCGGTLVVRAEGDAKTMPKIWLPSKGIRDGLPGIIPQDIISG